MFLKRNYARGLICIGMDAVFRFINRRKLLVVMYHGITRRDYEPPIWTQLPVNTFREQLECLRQWYVFVTLDDVVAAVRGERELPPSAALITFDDGLKNNFDVAFPVLCELGIPATIFLTVDLIGTEKILWFDELYFLLRQGYDNKVDAAFLDAKVRSDFIDGKIWDVYCAMVEMLKRCGEKERTACLKNLQERIFLNTLSLQDDFGLLNWEQVCIMRDSGLVSFGVHTASHRILSQLPPSEREEEIAMPRRKLEEFIGTPVLSFCFPNGKPGIDFNNEHLQYIRHCGYVCAFTTENRLFLSGVDDPMTIGRIPAGNDATSLLTLFRLNSSGCFTSFKRRKACIRNDTTTAFDEGFSR